jgi:hypothetical protein
MDVRRYSASLLLALLWPNAAGQPLRLQHLAPQSMTRVGAPLRIDYDSSYGFQTMAFADGRFVVRVEKGLEVVDAASLRVVVRYPLARSDVCAVDFDGAAVVALLGCKSVTSNAHTLWRFTSTSRRAIPVRHLDPLRWPVTFAVGDGKWFVARAGGSVDVVDLETGVVVHRSPRRVLSKGAGFTTASWLGQHRLGLNGTVVDVRSWRARTIAPGARRLIAAGGYVLAYGTDGITVFDDRLQLYRRLARGLEIDDLGVSDGVAYAQIGLVWDLYDVRSGKHLDTVLPDTPWLVRLVS